MSAPPEPQPPPPEPPPHEPPGRRERPFPTALVVLAVIVLGGFLFVGWVGSLLPDFSNPFREETIDRTGPAVLQSVRDLRDYRAASGHFQVIVDIERETRFVPSSIRGERVLFVAVGSVDAGVDFSTLEDGALEVSDDRRTVRLELPPARFHDPELDLDQSYVYDRDLGAIDRIGRLFGDGGDDAELYRLAEDRIAAAARDDSGLLRRAEENTRAMLVSLLRSLGFTRVEISFADV